MNEFDVKKETLKRIIRQHSKAGNYVEAIPYMEEYVNLIKNNFGADSERYITVLNDLGGMYRNIGNFEKSYETFNLALNLIESKKGNKSEQYATATVNLACMYRLTKEFDKAEAMFLNALNIYNSDEEMKKVINFTSTLDKDELIRKSTLYANASNNLANLYQDMGKINDAILYLSKSLDLLNNTTNYEYIAITMSNLVNPMLQLGNIDEAFAIANKSIDIFKTHLSMEHPSALTALNNLGTVHFYNKDYKKALECYKKVEPLLKLTYSENSPQYKYCLVNIEETKKKLNSNKNTNEQLIAEIIKIEWDMFQKVNNIGGRASCQDNFKTFLIMRTSQFNAWETDILNSYLEDLNTANANNQNLITEKYARMMKYTYNNEYELLKDKLPKISTEKENLVNKITILNKEQNEIFAKKYPKLKSKGRPDQNTKYASTDIYFEGEIYTYSEKTLKLLYSYLLDLKSRNENLPIMINTNIAKANGYKSIEDAENSLQ